MTSMRFLIAWLATALFAIPVSAQDDRSGRVAQSSVGQAGQRQTRDQFATEMPTMRVDSRIQTRVESRLRTRIDRYYNRQPGSTAALETAASQVRAAAETPRR